MYRRKEDIQCTYSTCTCTCILHDYCNDQKHCWWLSHIWNPTTVYMYIVTWSKFTSHMIRFVKQSYMYMYMYFKLIGAISLDKVLVYQAFSNPIRLVSDVECIIITNVNAWIIKLCFIYMYMCNVHVHLHVHVHFWFL